MNRKNRNYLIIICFFCILFTFCREEETNTWTVRSNFPIFGEMDLEYRIITEEQYERILRQRTVNNEYGAIYFTDELESRNNGKVIKGKAPKLNGYYYILLKTTARDKELANQLLYSGFEYSLQYGNSDIGWLSIVFWNFKSHDDAYLLSSEEFRNVLNQNIKLVKGE